MSHIKSSLSKLSGMAVAAGIAALAACGGSRSSPANASTSAQSTPPEQYGSAMGQPSGNGNAPWGETTTQQYSGTATFPGTSAPSTSDTGTTTSNSPSGATGSPSATGSAGATGGMMDVSSLNDAQLAAVIQAMNEGEIQAAQLAQNKASSAQVKRFAHDMLTAHRDMMNQYTALLARLQITPMDNAISNQLKTDAQTEMSTLQGVRGKDFDRTYVDAQVRDHNKALELIDRTLPNVKNSEMKSSLQSARSKVEAHLRHAEKLQQDLQTGTTNTQGGK